MQILEPTPGAPQRRRPRGWWLLIAGAVGALFAWLTGGSVSTMVLYAGFAALVMGAQLLFQRWLERPVKKPDPDAPPKDWSEPDAHQERFLGLPVGETGAQMVALVVTIAVMLLIYGTGGSPWSIAIVALGLFGVLGVMVLRRALGM